MEVPSVNFNFGEVYHQDKLVHAFVVRNRGAADLLINDVSPG
jgi:hypothetical protein